MINYYKSNLTYFELYFTLKFIYISFSRIESAQNYSSISIFFKGLSGTRIKRDVSVSWTQIFGK